MKAGNDEDRIKAVLGPTNTGKTHLAIERMCAHSSGMMGFPLRLLAREVYDRVCRIKGEQSVALITGEERIEPPQARYFCCTVEAMPVLDRRDRYAFVALDEAQLGADPERGHIFTDRLLHARGREETLLLGSATLEPMVGALVPEAEMVARPRFSTLSHAGSVKLSRLPHRSAVVAFTTGQVYALAEMLRRFRGGAAVVTGALSPETRNRQVELFQSGEVNHIVATDAIGMGLNLDLDHVAFAALAKFDGTRNRRLTPAEMAQIAGRAGRHQRDGTFGTLAYGLARGPAQGQGEFGAPPQFTDEEIFAIEEHRFAPLTQLFWRESAPSFDTLDTLIADLERAPESPQLRAAPLALDLAVLKRLAAEPLAQAVRGAGQVRRLWEACSLPDFRQLGADNHARFVARLWQDLGQGYLGADYVAARIAELDRAQGDIDTLQGRIAAIRSWAYICQQPDWVLARAVEAKLSDALHARLTERFVNRRTAILMKSLGQDGAALPVALGDDGSLAVEGEVVGRIEGFRFTVDAGAGHADRRMLLAAGERVLPALLARRAEWLLGEGMGELVLRDGAIEWESCPIASVSIPPDFSEPQIAMARETGMLAEPARGTLEQGLRAWLEARIEPLAPLRILAQATRDSQVESQARALLHTLVAGHGVVSREDAGLEHLPKELRPVLRRLGVSFGALDIFVPALLKPAPRRLLRDLGLDRRPLEPAMQPVIAARRPQPAGYRLAGAQAIRIDLAEKLLRQAFDARARAGERRPGKPFALDPALAISIGLEEGNYRRLLGSAGFSFRPARALAERAFGPPAPDLWHWRPRPKPRGADGNHHDNRGAKRKGERGAQHAGPQGPARGSGAFDALAGLLG